jgi:hypothetical protein
MLASPHKLGTISSRKTHRFKGGKVGFPPYTDWDRFSQGKHIEKGLDSEQTKNEIVG